MLINKSSILMGKHLYWVVFFCQNSWPFQQLLLVLNVCLVCTEHYSWAHSRASPFTIFFKAQRGMEEISLSPFKHNPLNSPKWLALHDCFKHMDIEKDNSGSFGPVVCSIGPLIFAWDICIRLYWLICLFIEI